MNGKCRTCKFWQVYENDDKVGMCIGIGVMKAGFKLEDPATVAVTHIDPDSLAANPPISDYIIRTPAEFGCISYRPEDKETSNGSK